MRFESLRLHARIIAAGRARGILRCEHHTRIPCTDYDHSGMGRLHGCVTNHYPQRWALQFETTRMAGRAQLAAAMGRHGRQHGEER